MADVTPGGSALHDSGSSREAVVPAWLVNLAALGWRAIAITALLLVSWLLAGFFFTVTASIAVAIVISALFAPWAQRLRVSGRSPTAAAGLVWAGALGCMTLLIALLAVAFVPKVVELLDEIGLAFAAVEAWIASLSLPPVIVSAVHGIATAVQGMLGDAFGTVAGHAGSTITIVILSSFLVFFFLRDGDRAWAWVFQAAAPDKRERITVAGSDALGRVGGYLMGTTILSAIIAATNLVFMLVLGVPLAVPLSLLVFLSGYIPYFGGIVTTFLILVIIYATLGTWPVVVMVVLIGIRNAILGYGVRPIVYGRTVSIHPALVLVALPAGFQLAGIVGLFAAVPVVAVVLAVSRATVAILEPDPRPELPGLVPAWLDRLAQWSWRLLLGVGLVALVVGLFAIVPLVLIPIVLALILAATLEPVVRPLIARGWGRGRAAAVAVGGGFLGIAAMLLFAVIALAGQVDLLARDILDGTGSLDGLFGGQLGLVLQAVGALLNGTVAAVLAVVSSISSILAMLVLGTLLAFYLLKDGQGLWERIVGRALPANREHVRRTGQEAFGVLGGYMFGTAIISLVGAASQLVIMLVLGIPLAVPIFVLSFFLCFIPYVGGFVSTGAAFLLAIAVGSPVDIAVMAVFTIVFNIVTGNIVSPIVYGKTVHLHPAVVLVAIPAGGAVAGVLGMFLVVPAIGVVAVSWRTALAVMAARESDQPDLPADGGADR